MQNEATMMTFRASDGNTVKLEYHRSLPSASDLAKEYARRGYPDRYVVFAEKQTGASAVDGSVSDNNPESGLYLSCILRPSIFPSQAGALGALSAVAFALALEEHTMQKIGIGWVSDIYCADKKIGYTSVEGKLDDYTSYEYLIVNFAVKLDPKRFTPRLTDMLRRVFEEENLSIHAIMAKTVLNRFFAIYREIKNPAKHLNSYASKSVLIDKKIKYIENGKKKTVKVVGINKTNLALTVETRDGRTIDVTSPSAIILPSRIK